MTPLLQTHARAIVAAHAWLALEPGAPHRLQALLSNADQKPGPGALTDVVHAAARLACQALDFCDVDAQCVAQAWQQQTARTGRFDTAIWPSAAQDFGIRRPDPSSAFAPCPQRLGLYAVLPDAAWVGRMAHAGVPTLQLRFKSDDPEAITREVQAAVQAIQGTPALLFINDHWQAAIDTGAYGVHLGQDDLNGINPANLVALRAAGLRLGLSSHGYCEMLRAAALQPSYIALGAVYATTLKRMATSPQGPQRLKVYRQLLGPIPSVAIGGIDLNRLGDVLASGVGSVAVVRALVAAGDPEASVQAFQKKLAHEQRTSDT